MLIVVLFAKLYQLFRSQLVQFDSNWFNLVQWMQCVECLSLLWCRADKLGIGDGWFCVAGPAADKTIRKSGANPFHLILM